MVIPNRKALLDVVTPIAPYSWNKHTLTIVGDGYLDNGTRVHLVAEKLEKQPIQLSNALVISVHDDFIFTSSSGLQ